MVTSLIIKKSIQRLCYVHTVPVITNGWFSSKDNFKIIHYYYWDGCPMLKQRGHLQHKHMTADHIDNVLLPMYLNRAI